MIDARAVEEVLQQELNSWDGPVHYVPIHHVNHKRSALTPCHLVINSSFYENLGLSQKRLSAEGPNVFSDMWSLLVRFRSYHKAYYAMKTGHLERHVRRFV